MSQPWSQSERDRLLGHRDGIVTALLQVRTMIGAVQYRYQHTSPHHTKKLAKRDAILQPLRDLERILDDKRHGCQTAYDARQFEAIVAAGTSG